MVRDAVIKQAREQTRRTRAVLVTLSESDYGELLAQARKGKVTPTALARAIILAGLREAKR